MKPYRRGKTERKLKATLQRLKRLMLNVNAAQVEHIRVAIAAIEATLDAGEDADGVNRINR